MRQFKYGLLLIIGLAITACDAGTSAKGITEVSVDQVHALLAKQDKPMLLLDVRTPGEYASGHVPTAKNIPVGTLANRLQEVPKDVDVYVYCESGVRSTRAAELLAASGYTKVNNMRASMRGWRSANFTIEQ